MQVDQNNRIRDLLLPGLMPFANGNYTDARKVRDADFEWKDDRFLVVTYELDKTKSEAELFTKSDVEDGSYRQKFKPNLMKFFALKG